MKRITKIALTVAVILFAGNVFAQSFGDVFNSATELMQAGKKVEAANQFSDALRLALEAGEEGVDIADQCKEIIPALLNQAAAEKVSGKDYQAAKEIYSQVKSFGEKLKKQQQISIRFK